MWLLFQCHFEDLIFSLFLRVLTPHHRHFLAPTDGHERVLRYGVDIIFLREYEGEVMNHFPLGIGGHGHQQDRGGGGRKGGYEKGVRRRRLM